jgi:hypothetical protein
MNSNNDKPTTEDLIEFRENLIRLFDTANKLPKDDPRRIEFNEKIKKLLNSNDPGEA